MNFLEAVALLNKDEHISMKSLSVTNISNELKDLNSKIDKIVIFLDLDAEEVGE